MSDPAVWSLAQLLEADLGRAVVWVTPSVAGAAAALPWPVAEPLQPLPPGTQSLVVIGGGALIDEAKAYRAREARTVRLIAVASRWGSGAEASPVTVLDRSGRKEIHLDAAWLPDATVEWPELALSLPESLARQGCADALSHAVEGFLSPIAAEPLRAEIAEVIRRMLQTERRSPAWFELSRRACSAQARSSVGLVHGIAHTIEGPLRAAGTAFGHARLCATFLWPVLRLDLTSSPKPGELFLRHGIHATAVESASRDLFAPADFASCLPLLKAHWRDVLRDPCTRTNCVLVRPGTLELLAELGQDARS